MKKAHFEVIMQGMDEARRWAPGEHVPGLRVHYFPKEDVATIRNRTDLTQEEFSAQIGVSAATLRNWEHGRCKPDGPARVLLAMLERDLQIIRKTLDWRTV